MPTVTVDTELQKLLKDAQLYDGLIDGKISRDVYDAIDKLLDTYKIEDTGWKPQRRYTAAKQILFSANKINPGTIDGLEGPQTKHAQDIFESKLVPVWRDKAESLDPPKTAEKKIREVHFDWPLQKDCMTYYGKVGTNQVDCELPFDLVLAWEPKTKLRKYSCHRLVKEPMEKVWNRTFDTYGYEKIKELRLNYFGGCLNVRKMRGGSSWSMHSWGIAIDIDPDRNDLHTSWKNAQMSKPEYKKFVQFWYDEGAINLGLEADYDAMHFQFARLR
jgi:hypothetical protein